MRHQLSEKAISHKCDMTETKKTGRSHFTDYPVTRQQEASGRDVVMMLALLFHTNIFVSTY
ncbi:hypothetical protein DZJ_20050 [Dickeya ananatis]